MQADNILKEKKQLKSQIEVGDFKLLAKALDVSYIIAYKKFERNNLMAVFTMKEIIKRRQVMINDLIAFADQCKKKGFDKTAYK